MTLLLFDIDQTLVVTHGAGREALLGAASAQYGRSIHDEGVAYAGQIDPVILRGILEANDCPADAEAVEALRRDYAKKLPDVLDGREARTLGGVEALLDRLAESPVALGLLTGNFPETGSAKLRAAGIDPERFQIHAWGSDAKSIAPSRNQLPVVAMARYAERYGHDVAPRDVIVIGDTPSDVECAQTNGCRCLAVATGYFDVATLTATGADHVVADLTDTETIAAWLTTRA